MNHDKLFEIWPQLLTVKQFSLGRKRMLGPTSLFLVALYTHCDCQRGNLGHPYFLRV